MAGIIIYDNEGACVYQFDEWLPIVQDFFRGMLSGGTAYNHREQQAINDLVAEVLGMAGISTVLVFPAYSGCDAILGGVAS